MYCTRCKEHYDEGMFCPVCGSRLTDDAPRQARDGFALNLGDANAISGGVQLTDSHEIHTTNTHYTTSNTVNNSTVYAAQKTEAELRQDNERLFVEAARERMADGRLDQRELAELNILAQQYNIPPLRVQQVIDQLRSSAQALQGGQGVEFLAQQTLEEVYAAIGANQTDVLQRRLPALEKIAQSTPDANVQFYYYLLMASLRPEATTIDFLHARTDNYWQLFWVHIAYVKLAQTDNATVLLPRLGGFGSPKGDLALLMAIDNLAEYRRGGEQDYYMLQAQTQLMQAKELGMSEPLTALWSATKEAMLDEPDPEPWFRFYVEQTLKELCPANAPAMPQTPPQMPKMEVPPMPKFNAQNVCLAQMQGFNPLQAAQQMGIGMTADIKKKPS